MKYVKRNINEPYVSNENYARYNQSRSDELMIAKYTALDVAKHIVNYVNDLGLEVTNLKLQSILYLVQIEFIKTNEPLFSDEFEAWSAGPLIDNIFSHFKKYADSPIIRTSPPLANIDNHDVQRINKIVDVLILEPSWSLAQETRNPGGPWHKAFEYSKRNVITHASIRGILSAEDWINKIQ